MSWNEEDAPFSIIFVEFDDGGNDGDGKMS